jgi:glutaredoxin 3
MQIKMYTRGSCSFCYAARRLLAKRNLAFEEISIMGNILAEQEMQDLTGRTSVPQIVIDGKPIGGYTDLVELDMEGEL